MRGVGAPRRPALSGWLSGPACHMQQRTNAARKNTGARGKLLSKLRRAAKEAPHLHQRPAHHRADEK